MSDIVVRLLIWPAADGKDGLAGHFVEALMREAADEIERLRRIEQAAQRAYDYHLLGYGEDTSDFDANDQIALMEALGRALEGQPTHPAAPPDAASPE